MCQPGTGPQAAKNDDARCARRGGTGRRACDYQKRTRSPTATGGRGAGRSQVLSMAT